MKNYAEYFTYKMDKRLAERGVYVVFPQKMSAEGGTRTRTTARSHAPETCVSTNFTTSARKKQQCQGKNSTRGGARTRTKLPSLDFESSASTSSATLAATSKNSRSSDRPAKLSHFTISAIKRSIFLHDSHSFNPLFHSTIPGIKVLSIIFTKTKTT